MDNLNNIPNVGNWGDAASRLNDNFNKIKQAVTTVENTSKNNKGYFTSLSALNTAFPSPKAGQTAYVYDEASSTKYYIYNAVDGAWVATSIEAPSVGVDLAEYTKTGGSTKTLKEVDDDLAQLAGELDAKANHGYESNPKTLKEVDESVNDVRNGLGSLGLEQVLGYNFIEHLYGISREDTEVWGNGYLADDGSIVVAGNWLHTMDYIPVYKGTYDVNLLMRGDACLLIYNNKKEVVKAEKSISDWSVTTGRSITIEENGYIRFSYPPSLDEGGTYKPLEERHFINTSAVIFSDNSVFLKTNEAEKLIPDTVNTILSHYGLTPILPGNNFISELTGSSVLDTSLWGNGFLTSSGNIFTAANWYHSKKYYRLPRGSYQMYFYISGNAKVLVYDENKENIIRVLEKSGSIDGKQFDETFDQDVYLRISHREGEGTEGRTNDIYVVNTANVYDRITASINIDDKVTVGSNEAVASGAVPTFMRDIYKKMNPPKTKRPIVTFIADDGHINDKNWYIPLLDEYNVKSTHAIVKKYVVGADNGEYANRLNSEDIINLHKDGHDIASHTMNSLNLSQITLEEADNEIGGNYVFLRNLINDDVPMFISPFGIRNADLDEVIARYHKANFITGYGVRNETPIDSYFINRVSFDTLDNNVLLWESSLLPALNSCLENSEWLVFAVHPGYSTYTSSNPVYMERRNELRLIIEWCNNNDVQIMTAKNAYSYWRNPIEIGIKRKDVNYYRLGMDGTEEGEGILM
jgi:peptidoglycan/xylan/chitin deacetylase (PgdA/CDA1 family)